MKIFVSEYIICYETFDLNFYNELSISNFFFDYTNYFQSICESSNRFMYKRTYIMYDLGENRYLRKKQGAHDIIWKRRLRRRNIFFKLIPYYFVTPRKWLKWWAKAGVIPMVYKFYQYGYYNELVQHYYLSHSQAFVFRLEYPKLDCSLLYNFVHDHFLPRKIVYNFEKYSTWRRRGGVFYRARPYLKEFLPFAFKWYNEGIYLTLLNPDSKFFITGNSFTYARHWVNYAYMVYNPYRRSPFLVYGYWTSNFYTEIFLVRTIWWRYDFFVEHSLFADLYVVILDNWRSYVYTVFFSFMFYWIFFWVSMFYALYSSKEKLLRIIKLEGHLANFMRLRYFYFNKFHLWDEFLRRITMNRLEWEGREIRRKSQVDSKIMKFLRNNVFFVILGWYLVNIIKSDKYINKVENKYLGTIESYDSYVNYKYLWFKFLFLPTKFYYFIKGIFYELHTMFYLRVPKYIKYWSLHNPRFNYMYNRFFNQRVVNDRELDRVSAFYIVERIMNYKRLYSNDNFKEIITKMIYDQYTARVYAKTNKTRDEYWMYFYYRYFADYSPGEELWEILKARYFTRFFYYGVDFSKRRLATHNFFEFFNFFTSPLHIRFNSTYLLNFYYVWIYSKQYYTYVYYSFYYFSKIVDINLFYIYVNYFFSIILYVIRFINNFINKFLDGMNIKFLIFLLKKNLYIFFLFLQKKYFIVKYFRNIFWIVNLTVYYLFYLLGVNIKLIVFFILEKLKENFSDFFINDFGFSYKFWQRYYMMKFYLIEYNIFYNIIKVILNFIFNFLLILIFFFIIFSVPYIKDLVFSDYLIYWFYRVINKLFVYNKFIYFNEVLDNWWVPYFQPHKFIKFYNGYLNYFEVRLKKGFGRFIVNMAHAVSPRYFYNPHYFEIFITKYVKYLQFKKLAGIHDFFWRLFHNKYPWDIYLIVSAQFYLLRHPARHFMPDIFFNILPIIVSFYLRYMYYLVVLKIFVPCFWVWKYTYSYVVFNLLYYTSNTILFSFFFNFFKFWFNVYSYFRYCGFYFFFYYYYYFLFSVSKLMRYYFVTYDFLNYFWIYRSARFIISIDILNAFRFSLDCFYLIMLEFFKKIYNVIYFLSNLFGFTSFYSYSIFSLNFIPKFHLFVSEWMDKFITINWEIDEYGRVLKKHFRYQTRSRLGDWIKHSRGVRSVMLIKHTSTSFEFLIRDFLFFAKNKGFVKSFLLQNNVKTNTFNLFFFSFSSIYIHYISILFFFTVFSYKLRIFFKYNTHVNQSPFFTWNLFQKKNKKLLRCVEFYWLYNIRWLKTFDFYIDKHFTDDLYSVFFKENEVAFGLFIHKNFMHNFFYKEREIVIGSNHNKFLVYKRYFVERYITLMKDIEWVFYEYVITRNDHKQAVFSYYDLFIPYFNKRKFKFDFKKDLIKKFGNLDQYWLYIATPQIFYNRNFEFTRLMNKDDDSRLFYSKLKKSLFKAYSFFEMNQVEMPYDLFEFQFFDPNIYDAFTLENSLSWDWNYSKEKNNILQKVAASRGDVELVYESTPERLYNIYAAVGYHDWIAKIESYFDYLRYINNYYVDFGIFTFMKPYHKIITHVDADIVKNTIDLSVDDDAVGVKYSELYQYEDMGRVATEQHIFSFLDKVFYKIDEDSDLSSVYLSEDGTQTYRHLTVWTILVLLLPMLLIVTFFLSYINIPRYNFPHVLVREIGWFITYHLTSIVEAEVVWSNRMLGYEYFIFPYWKLPGSRIRTFIFDLNFLERYSHWEGKFASFVEFKKAFSWYFFLLANDDFRFDFRLECYRHFYIVAWLESRLTVLYFILLDIIFYILSIFFFLIIVNGTLWFSNFLGYFLKEPNPVLDDKTSELELEELRKKAAEKKSQIFDFSFKEFDDVKGKFNVHDRARAKRKKNIKKNK